MTLSAWSALVALALPSLVLGDELLLQSGETVQGRIVEQNAAYVRIDTVLFGIRATVDFKRRDIRRVVEGPLPDTFFDQPPAQPKVATPPPATRPPPRSTPKPEVSPAPAVQAGDVIAAWQRSRNGDSKAAAQLASMRADCQRRARRTELNDLGTTADRPVEVVGWIRRETSGRLSITTSRRSDLKVPIGPLIVPEADSERLQAGRYVTLTGYTDGTGGVVVLKCQVPEPACEYRHQLEEHIVIGGSWQNWTVKVTMSNTGKQPIKSVSLAVNCYQTHGPNDGDNAKTVTFRNLDPGDVQTQEVVFNLYNFQYIGRTSMPKTGATLGPIEW